MQLLADIRNGTAGVTPPSALGLGDGKTQVAKGHTAMSHRGVFDVSYFLQNSEYDWDVVGMPAMVTDDGARHRATFYSPEAWVVPRDAKNPELAFEFIKFILQEEQMSEFAAIGAIIPSQPSVAINTFFQIDPSKNLRAFLDALDYVSLQYWAHPAYNKLGLAGGDLLDQVLKGLQPAQIVVPEIASRANDILKEYFNSR